MRINSKILKNAREVKGITLQKLGEMIGMPAKSARINMCLLESGTRGFSAERAIKLSKILDIKVQDILGEIKDGK